MNKRTTGQVSYARSVAYGALAGLSIAIIFAAGFFARDLLEMTTVRAIGYPSEGIGYPLLDEVQELLNAHYLREQPPYTRLQYAAIRGVMGALEDRYTFFIDPPVAQSESDALAGTYGGIGVQLQRSASGDFVLFPFPDGPAARAGIRDGDVLLAINDVSVDQSSQQDVVDQQLRGEVKEGNGIQLALTRADGSEAYTVFVAFDVINVPSVVWRLVPEDSRIGYVQIIRFTSRTPDELVVAVEDLRSHDILALVLDLRDNNGGLLQESIEVADELLDGGVIAFEQSQRTERTFEAEVGGIAADLPLAVLVNGGTASAAEIVAGAVQDSERGILVGQGTFGKGTVQQIFRLTDDSSIHITSAQWLTPARMELDGSGIEPTISMIPDENGRDIEIGEAVHQLQELLATQDN
jgi:carboxyl-terminal processing protease